MWDVSCLRYSRDCGDKMETNTMPTAHLTELTVRRLRASDRTTAYWDTTTPAFGIRVGKRARTWVVMRGRDRQLTSIGHYPDLSLAEARAEAKRLLTTVPEPKTPSLTFRAARDTFLEEHYRDKAPRTRYNVSGLMKRHFKALEPMQLGEIEDTDIKRSLDKLASTPSEQLHAYRALRCFFRWCVRPPRRFIKHSPMEGYEPPGKDRKGTRTLTDDELKAVWNACQKPSHAVVRLMILWGTRNTETAVLERIWRVDDVLTIPGEHTKNGRDHAVPILPLADTILAGTVGSNEHYFAGRWGTGHVTARGVAMILGEVKKLSKTSGWTPRDIRRTFRTNMRRFGVAPDVCEALINHAPAALIEIYDRYHLLPEKRDALARYEAFIHTLTAQG